MTLGKVFVLNQVVLFFRPPTPRVCWRAAARARCMCSRPIAGHRSLARQPQRPMQALPKPPPPDSHQRHQLSDFLSLPSLFSGGVSIFKSFFVIKVNAQSQSPPRTPPPQSSLNRGCTCCSPALQPLPPQSSQTGSLTHTHWHAVVRTMRSWK